MKIDLHVHSGLSECASTNYIEAVDAYGDEKIDFVLCNHYNALYTSEYGGKYSKRDFPKVYVDEFYRTAEYAKTKDVHVFFGIEVAISLPDCPYAEYLVYGAKPEFLLANPTMYELDQRGLYDLVHGSGFMLVQAHPFRKEQGHFPHDMKLVDGVEINCHYRFLREEERVRALAEQNGLIVTCGSDFHRKGQEGAGGIICDEVKSESELKDVLLGNKFEIFTR